MPAEAMHPHWLQSGLPPNWQGVIGFSMFADTHAVVSAKTHSSGECGGFTVPAINVRMLAYDTARAIFRAARAGKAGAIILEIARSEIAYTGCPGRSLRGVGMSPASWAGSCTR